MLNNKPSTFKEALGTAKATAPRVEEIKRVSYGIPRAENADPNLAALQASNGSKKAADLLAALVGTGKAVDASMKSQEETFRDWNARLIEKQKLNPEQWGKVGDASNLPFQHNPIAMKIYNRDAGRDLATRTGMNTLSRLMNSKDAEELSTEDFISKWKEETIKEAAGLGLDTNNETQLLSFSTTLDPIGIKGALQHQQFVSERMKKDQAVKSTASAFGALTTAEPGMVKDALLGSINEMYGSIGVKATHRMLPDLLTMLVNSGARDDVIEEVGNHQIEGVSLFDHTHMTPKEAIWKATTQRGRMGDEAIESWKTELGGVFNSLELVPVDADTSEVRANFESVMSRLPASMANQKADILNRFEGAMVRRARMGLENAAKQRKAFEDSSIAKSNIMSLASNPYAELTRGDKDTGYRDVDGNPIIANGDKQTVTEGANTFNGLLQQYYTNPSNQNLQALVVNGGNIYKGLVINGMEKEANDLIVSPMTKRVDAMLNDPKVVGQIEKGNIPPALFNTFKFLDSINTNNPSLLDKSIRGSIKSVNSVRDAFGVNTEDALKIYAQSRSTQAATSDKEGKKINFENELRKEFGSKITDSDIPWMADAMEVAVKSGRSLKQAVQMAKDQMESPNFFDWSFTNSKIPRSAFGDRIGRYPDLETYVKQILDEETTRTFSALGINQPKLSDAGYYYRKDKGAIEVVYGRHSIEVPIHSMERRINDLEIRARTAKVSPWKEKQLKKAGKSPSGLGQIVSEGGRF